MIQNMNSYLDVDRVAVEIDADTGLNELDLDDLVLLVDAQDGVTVLADGLVALVVVDLVVDLNLDALAGLVHDDLVLGSEDLDLLLLRGGALLLHHDGELLLLGAVLGQQRVAGGHRHVVLGAVEGAHLAVVHLADSCRKKAKVTQLDTNYFLNL